MKKPFHDFITKSTTVKTLGGELIATGSNGSLIFFEEYEINENDEMEFIGERSLTTSEVSRIMKELDGTNHKVMWLD